MKRKEADAPVGANPEVESRESFEELMAKMIGSGANVIFYSNNCNIAYAPKSVCIKNHYHYGNANNAYEERKNRHEVEEMSQEEVKLYIMVNSVHAVKECVRFLELCVTCKQIAEVLASMVVKKQVSYYVAIKEEFLVLLKPFCKNLPSFSAENIRSNFHTLMNHSYPQVKQEALNSFMQVSEAKKNRKK